MLTYFVQFCDNIVYTNQTRYYWLFVHRCLLKQHFQQHVQP